MHHSALKNIGLFIDLYVENIEKKHFLEIGSQDVNGSVRSLVSPIHDYIGVDFQKAPGVDILLDDPYKLPFEDAKFDFILSSSCFEHSEFFWLVFLEIIRCLKKGGVFYLNAPSAGAYHRFPVDSWRFYPDSGIAMVKWAERNGLSCYLNESFIDQTGSWNDFVAVFVKGDKSENCYLARMIDHKGNWQNGYSQPELEIKRFSPLTPLQKKFKSIS